MRVLMPTSHCMLFISPSKDHIPHTSQPVDTQHGQAKSFVLALWALYAVFLKYKSHAPRGQPPHVCLPVWWETCVQMYMYELFQCAGCRRPRLVCRLQARGSLDGSDRVECLGAGDADLHVVGPAHVSRPAWGGVSQYVCLGISKGHLY